LEAITGVDYSWISKFEKGLVNFEIDTLIKLVSGLSITWSMFVILSMVLLMNETAVFASLVINM